ncbi:MAG: hypothetical protein GY806_05370 [Gammaproteobacteria bacterium]|nr:hypothetical protein [Gammaproteobacteria bacterium]
MFESLAHWFDSLAEESRLFNNRNDETLHSALASVLYHIISADKKVANKEKHQFARILKQEFGLDDDQVNHLFEAAKSSTADPQDDLHTVNHYLKQQPLVRMNFMQKLIQLVDINGTEDSELALFYQTLHEVFPEIKQD